jgi:transcriptional regulator with XRE-family HTH domain
VQLEPANRAQDALRQRGVTVTALAKLIGVSKMTASRWLRGLKAPDEKHAAAIAVAFGVPADWWRRDSASGLAVELRNRPKPLAADGPRSLVDELDALLEGGTLSAAERQQALALQLRKHALDVDAALEQLTIYDKVVCHASFVGMRARLERLFEGEPEGPAVLAALPMPPPDGPVARLRDIRGELERLEASCEAFAASLLGGGAVGRANQLHSHASRAHRLLEKARITATPKELFSSDTWRQCVRQLSDVLRKSPDALQATIAELEPLDDDFSRVMRDALRIVRFITWPTDRYQRDIVGFAREILGVELWSKQEELVTRVLEHDWVACASGHRIGKSLVLAVLALWFYCCFPKARVFITAPTDRQLQEVDWREIRMRFADSGICLDCRLANKGVDPMFQVKAPCPHSAKIEGDMRDRATGGLHSEDFRQIIGFSAKDAESAAGLAGENLMFLVEEASGVPQPIYNAIKGNLAGGGKLILLGNPTRNEGEMYDAFYPRKGQQSEYSTMRVSSEETPNVVHALERGDPRMIKGLSTKAWCEARAREWGKDSALYKVRVLGQHALGEDGRLISIALIVESESRWLEADEDGTLYIGIDPAGPTGSNDETGFAARRNKKALEVGGRRGLDEDDHLALVLELISRHGVSGECAIVNVDSDGLGAGIISRLRQYESGSPGVFKVFDVKPSHPARREPQVYDTTRDELAANLARWLRGGAGIPEDVLLAAEMHAYEMTMKLVGKKGERTKVTPKEQLKKALGRSPDRCNALELSVWEQREEAITVAGMGTPAVSKERLGHGGIDPYAGGQRQGNRAGGALDPYG